MLRFPNQYNAKRRLFGITDPWNYVHFYGYRKLFDLYEKFRAVVGIRHSYVANSVSLFPSSVVPSGLLCGEGWHDTGALPLPGFRRPFGTFAAPCPPRRSMRSPSPPFPKEGSGVVCQRCPNLFVVPKGRRNIGRGIAPANRRHKNKSRRDDRTDAQGLSSLRDYCVVGVP